MYSGRKVFCAKRYLETIRSLFTATSGSNVPMENLNSEFEKLVMTDVAAKNIISLVIPDNTSLSARRILLATAKQLSLDSLQSTSVNVSNTTSIPPASERISVQPNAKAGIASNAPDYSVQLNMMSKADFIQLQNDRRQGLLHTGLSVEDNFNAGLFFKCLDERRATIPKKSTASAAVPVSQLEQVLAGAPPAAQPAAPESRLDYHDWRALVAAGECDEVLREWSTSSATGYPLGHMVLHAPVAQSSHALMTTTLSPLPAGLVFVADTQTSGRGRGGNDWSSPAGCLMSNVSFQVQSAHLLPFAQYLLCWAVVGAVKEVAPLLDVGIKWPNDVYMNGGKIGGILCQSSFDPPVQGRANSFTVHAGFGINVSRGGAFATLNSGIRALRQAESKQAADEDALPPLEDIPSPGESATVAVRAAADEAEADGLTREELLARIVHRLALALPLFNKFGFAPFEREYMQWWLHRGAAVRVEGHAGEYVLTGFAPSGYLRAEAGDEVLELHPDGNSFDVTQRFIAAKKLK